MSQFALNLPPLPHSGSRTYAAWPVWSDSAAGKIRTSAISLNTIRTYYRELCNRLLALGGRHAGVLSGSLKEVYQALVHYMNNSTGRCFPSYDALARASGRSRDTVWRALRTLRRLGIVTWQRRCRPSASKDNGSFILEQDSNMYALLPPSQWREPPPEEAKPMTGSWGAPEPSTDQPHDVQIDKMNARSLDELARMLTDSAEVLALNRSDRICQLYAKHRLGMANEIRAIDALISAARRLCGEGLC